MINGSKISEIIKNGGVGVIATDTLYGLVGSAFSRQVVERIYKLKGRRPDKPLIILISQVSDMGQFGVELDQSTRTLLNKYWPGPVSIILPCPRKDLHYLHRGTNTLAFRLPAKSSLRRLLKDTGPIVAPSANPEGMPPAASIADARGYFGEQVEFYRRGRVNSRPSKLIAINKDGGIKVLRP